MIDTSPANIAKIQHYLLVEYIDDDAETSARKHHILCKELLNAYLECEARRAEWFATAMAAGDDLREGK